MSVVATTINTKSTATDIGVTTTSPNTITPSSATAPSVGVSRSTRYRPEHVMNDHHQPLPISFKILELTGQLDECTVEDSRVTIPTVLTKRGLGAKVVHHVHTEVLSGMMLPHQAPSPSSSLLLINNNKKEGRPSSRSNIESELWFPVWLKWWNGVASMALGWEEHADNSDGTQIRKRRLHLKSPKLCEVWDPSHDCREPSSIHASSAQVQVAVGTAAISMSRHLCVLESVIDKRDDNSDHFIPLSNSSSIEESGVVDILSFETFNKIISVITYEYTQRQYHYHLHLQPPSTTSPIGANEPQQQHPPSMMAAAVVPPLQLSLGLVLCWFMERLGSMSACIIGYEEGGSVPTTTTAPTQSTQMNTSASIEHSTQTTRAIQGKIGYNEEKGPVAKHAKTTTLTVPASIFVEEDDDEMGEPDQLSTTPSSDSSDNDDQRDNSSDRLFPSFSSVSGGDMDAFDDIQEEDVAAEGGGRSSSCIVGADQSGTSWADVGGVVTYQRTAAPHHIPTTLTTAQDTTTNGHQQQHSVKYSPPIPPESPAVDTYAYSPPRSFSPDYNSGKLQWRTSSGGRSVEESTTHTSRRQREQGVSEASGREFSPHAGGDRRGAEIEMDEKYLADTVVPSDKNNNNFDATSAAVAWRIFSSESPVRESIFQSPTPPRSGGHRHPSIEHDTPAAGRLPGRKAPPVPTPTHPQLLDDRRQPTRSTSIRGISDCGSTTTSSSTTLLLHQHRHNRSFSPTTTTTTTRSTTPRSLSMYQYSTTTTLPQHSAHVGSGGGRATITTDIATRQLPQHSSEVAGGREGVMVARSDAVNNGHRHTAYHPKNSIFVFRSSSVTQSEVRSEVVVEQRPNPQNGVMMMTYPAVDDGGHYQHAYHSTNNNGVGEFEDGDSYPTTTTDNSTAPTSPDAVQRVRSKLRRRTNTLPPSEPTTPPTTAALSHNNNSDDVQYREHHQVANTTHLVSSLVTSGGVVVGHSTNGRSSGVVGNNNLPSTRSLANNILDRANRTVSPIRVGYRFKQQKQ